MKVVVVGTRGIPRIQGGVETHCEQLCPRLVELGCDVTVVRRSPYVTPDNRIPEYKGVRLVDVYAPRRKSVEALIHTLLAVVKAKRLGADVVHIHAVGPSLLTPVARLLGLKVVCTNHGPDYNRLKWGRVARAMIHLGEWLQVKCAHRIIAISRPIADNLARNYGRTDGVSLIPNGIPHAMPTEATDYITSLGLRPERYVVALGRIVPEKRFDLLIEAFSEAQLRDYKLVIVGAPDHETAYAQQIKRLIKTHDVTATGFICGEQMIQVMSHAALFCLPSTHEGLPISLLEAMSYGLDVLVSDIEANRLPQLADSDFFPVDNRAALVAALRRKLASPQRRAYDLSDYDWDSIAVRTLEVYRSIV